MSIVELAPIEALAKEILRRVLAEEDASELRSWIIEAVTRMGGAENSEAVMTWEQSFDFCDKMIDEYEKQARIPKDQRKILDWPWSNWNKYIDPLEAGLLATITAPDGQGKSIYAESIAEHWAQHKNRVAFVHYELNRKIMMMRRIARHASISVRAIKMGNLTADEKQIIAEIRPKLESWDGSIDYIHSPGWSIDKTIDELRKLNAEKGLDVVVIDYLEKIAPSQRQMRMFGTNGFMREADNVEQLKNFAESTGIPVLMVAQLNKVGKDTKFEDMNSSDMTGTAEKSNKSNLVVMLKRDRDKDGRLAETINVMIAKNTMGGTGVFRQAMEPQYFRVSDLD